MGATAKSSTVTHYPIGISPDGKLVAFPIRRPDGSNQIESVQAFHASPWTPKSKISLEGKAVSVRELAFASHGRVLIGRLGNRDACAAISNSGICEPARKSSLFPPPRTAIRSRIPRYHQTARPSAATTYSGSQAQIVLVDLRRRTPKVIELLSESYVEEPAFHPNGRLLAVPIQVVSGMKLARDTPATASPQPQIDLIDTDTGKIVEVIHSPQAFVLSSC